MLGTVSAATFSDCFESSEWSQSCRITASRNGQNNWRTSSAIRQPIHNKPPRDEALGTVSDPGMSGMDPEATFMAAFGQNRIWPKNQHLANCFS